MSKKFDMFIMTKAQNTEILPIFNALGNPIPLYLFVCVENSCRSQMAQGLFNAMAVEAQAESAGTLSSGQINPMAVEVMKERGIDISAQFSKKLTPKMVANAYRVVTMGCIDSCPYAPPEKRIDWNIPDPKGKDKKFFIEVRDLLEKKIQQLLKDVDL